MKRIVMYLCLAVFLAVPALSWGQAAGITNFSENAPLGTSDVKLSFTVQIVAPYSQYNFCQYLTAQCTAVINFYSLTGTFMGQSAARLSPITRSFGLNTSGTTTKVFTNAWVVNYGSMCNAAAAARSITGWHKADFTFKLKVNGQIRQPSPSWNFSMVKFGSKMTLYY